jgi:hypothetical protein
MLRRDERVPLPNEMGQSIGSAISRALFHQQVLAHIRMMNARRNADRVIMTIKNLKVTAVLALRCCDNIIAAARSVGKGVIEVKEHESSERLSFPAVVLLPSMRTSPDGLWKLQKEFVAENECVVIPIQVW